MSQARAPPTLPATPTTLEAPATRVVRVGLLVLVTRVGLVLRARASPTPSATLVAQLVLVVLGVGGERR